MRTKKHIEILLENGIHFNTVSKMSQNQIKVLAQKFIINEQSTVPQNTTEIPKPATKSYLVKSNSKTMINGVEIDTSGGKTVVTPLKEIGEEEEVKEKFESRAQQKLFFAKCGNGKTKEQKKWCRMRDEFAKSTSKKDQENLPEKLHPEKTVKYKKKRRNENFQRYLENRIVEMIEKHIEPRMTKSDILNMVMEKSKKSDSMVLKNPKKMSMFSDESGIEMKKGNLKKPIGNLFSLGEDTKEKERTKTKPGTKERKRQNPFKDPNPGVEEKPKAHTKEKERTKEREKTKTPTRRKGNPFKDPNPGVEEKPKAEIEKQKSDFMMTIKQALNVQ